MSLYLSVDRSSSHLCHLGGGRSSESESTPMGAPSARRRFLVFCLASASTARASSSFHSESLASSFSFFSRISRPSSAAAARLAAAAASARSAFSAAYPEVDG